MNKFLKMAAAALFTAFLVLPGMSRADAAMKLAVVPLIIGENVEDDAGLKPIAYSTEVSELFQYPEYDLVDSDTVRKAALAQQDNLFTKEGLEAIAKASGADCVVAMSVDKFDVEEDMDELMLAIQKAYEIAKENNRKYARKDHTEKND